MDRAARRSAPRARAARAPPPQGAPRPSHHALPSPSARASARCRAAARCRGPPGGIGSARRGASWTCRAWRPRQRRQHQAGWQGGRQIFERVYRHVDATVAERLLDLFRKEALPLELVQRAIDLRIAARLDDHELGVHAGPRERGLHPLGLPPCELAAARAKSQRRAHASRLPAPGSRSKCRTRASTKPATVYSSASIATAIPSSRAVPAVTGPITAAANRPDAAAGLPTRSTKPRTVEEEVNVTASIVPARISAARPLPSPVSRMVS